MTTVSVLSRCAALGALLVLTAQPLTAQTPEAGLPAGVSVAAANLVNPRGLAWDDTETLHVALAGLGGDSPSPGASAQEIANGLYYGGASGSIVKIADGCGVTIASGLSSTYGSGNHRHQGPAGLVWLDGTFFVTDDGAGPPHGDALMPNGVYAIDPATGGFALVSDFNAWVATHPVANVPGDFDPGGEPWDLVTDGSDMLVVESNSGQIIRVGVNGDTTRAVDLSEGHPVPTGLALAPDGTMYVGSLGVTPYLDGSTKVVKVAPDGTISDQWTGLTALTSLELGPDGALYALEMSTGNTTTPPFFVPASGRVVRQTGPDSLEVVVSGLDLPSAMSFGPDGALYISTPALRTPDETGSVLRVDLAQAATPVDLAGAAMPTSTCAIAGEPAGSIDIQVKFDNGEMPAPTPEAEGSGEATAAPASGDAISIASYAYAPATLEVSAGTTVTWTNNDSVPHTVTANDKSFDSGNMAPGATFTHTFATAGSYPYFCQYHAGMKGTVTVK
jgi:plastocyanin